MGGDDVEGGDLRRSRGGFASVAKSSPGLACGGESAVGLVRAVCAVCAANAGADLERGSIGKAGREGVWERGRARVRVVAVNGNGCSAGGSDGEGEETCCSV